jgi:hypothetical protein
VVPEPEEVAKHRPKNATFWELMTHGLGGDLRGHRMKYVATIFDKKGLARLLRAKGTPVAHGGMALHVGLSRTEAWLTRSDPSGHAQSNDHEGAP